MMLAEPYRELLCAYVDGELTAGQQRTIQRLLDSSPEARAYLRQLQADAGRLRNLPRRRLNPDFSDRVLGVIRGRNLRPGRRRPPPPPPTTLPVWVSVVCAAAVLLLVTSTSYVVFAHRDRPDNGGLALAQNGTPSTPAPEGRTTPEPSDKADPPAAPPEVRAFPWPEPKSTAKTPGMRPLPMPEPDQPPVTAPIPKLELFPKVPEPSLSIFRFEKLDQAALRTALAKNTSFRLELPVQESVKAFDRLRPAFKLGGLTLTIDPNARFRLDHPQLKTHFVVYTEALTPEDLVRLLGQIAAEDRKAEGKKRERQFKDAVLTPLTWGDRKELSVLMGIDPQKLQPKAVDPSGALLRNNKPAARPAERLALVLPYNPVLPWPGSPEVKQFLASLRQPHPGAIQLLLVLRELKG